MVDFWLGTFRLGELPADPVFSSLFPRGTDTVAIELLRDGDHYGVLFSSVDDAVLPSYLTCKIGFSNASKACNIWHDRGFPLVDAEIAVDTAKRVVQVTTSFFREPTSIQYDELLLELSGIDFTQQTGAPSNAPAAAYHQEQRSPDSVQPNLLITRDPVTWIPQRGNTYQIATANRQQTTLAVDPPAPRSPSLAPLSVASLELVNSWVGSIEHPPRVDRPLKSLPPINASEAFGLPAFRFEEVEILGFRIGLDGLGRRADKYLDDIVAPLNFHRNPDPSDPQSRRAIPDFRYRAATRTLSIELLRYSRMKSRAPVPPLTTDDIQSQHELMIRLLVGRVDDDTAQARSPAVFVPAIFVDNPWSKILGRDMLGFDKRMATFAVGQDGARKRLLPDGRLADRAVAGATARPPQGPVPLGDVSSISLAERTGGLDGPPLLDLEYSTTSHTDPDQLQAVNLDLADLAADLAGIRWRQTDFSDRVFGRSFAGQAVADSFRAFNCIQVAPVGERPEPPAWISGKFLLDPDIRVQLPFGVATLTLHTVAGLRTGASTPSPPAAWNGLCALLGDGRRAQVRLATGSWYRLVCSMDLTIDDGLEFDD